MIVLFLMIDYYYYRTDGFVGESYALEAAKRMNLPGNDDGDDDIDGHDNDDGDDDIDGNDNDDGDDDNEVDGEDVNEDEFDDDQCKLFIRL